MVATGNVGEGEGTRVGKEAAPCWHSPRSPHSHMEKGEVREAGCCRSSWSTWGS